MALVSNPKAVILFGAFFCNSSTRASAVWLFTVRSVGASANTATRTWDNHRQTKNYDRSFVNLPAGSSISSLA
jgi:hypothetical protein